MARAYFPRVIQQRVFTTEECKKIIDCQSTPVKSDGMGINYPIDIVDECSNNDWITNKVKDTLHKTNKRHYGFKDLKLFKKGIGKKTYEVGDSYRYHTDDISEIRLTSIIFLNDDFVGGKLRVFAAKEIVINPTIGLMVSFPSWYFHQADIIESGERKVLVILAEGPKFEFLE